MTRALSFRLLGLLLSLMVVLTSFSATAKERITYYHNDLLGSTVAATDAQGALLWQEDYSPYGKRLLKQDEGRNTRWYTGKSEVKALGVQYFDARWYDADLSRFLSVDPIDFDEGDINSFNRYAYANNNPYRYVDPTGESVFDAGFLAADVVKLGAAVYSGVGIGAAAIDVGISIVGVVCPVPGMGVLTKAAYAARVAKSVDKAADAGRVGAQYSVSFETKLKSSMYPGKSADAHFQAANEQLHKQMTSDPSFAKMMEDLNPGITQGVSPGARGKYPRRAPTKDTTWHHGDSPGQMQLVPKEHHQAKGPVQGTLHPGGSGGMKKWGGGR